jgi:hypothetical protein
MSDTLLQSAGQVAPTLGPSKRPVFQLGSSANTPPRIGIGGATYFRQLADLQQSGTVVQPLG